MNISEFESCQDTEIETAAVGEEGKSYLLEFDWTWATCLVRIILLDMVEVDTAEVAADMAGEVVVAAAMDVAVAVVAAMVPAILIDLAQVVAVTEILMDHQSLTALDKI